MSEINKSLVLAYVTALRAYVKRLTAFQQYSYDEFESDEAIYWAVEHGLQMAIQCVIDIGSHLLASQELARPEDYQQTILALGEHGVVPKEFAHRIAKMAGFRNILVHMYLGVDLKTVYDILQKNLSDFTEFANYIGDYLEEK